MNSINVIEKEYAYDITKDDLGIELPKVLGQLKLKAQRQYEIIDIPIERYKEPLIDNKIGMRIRIKNGTGIEFTYKKFLGKTKGLISYDERTVDFTKDDLGTFMKSGKLPLSCNSLPGLNKLDIFYPLLKIVNKRKEYSYENGTDLIEIVLEDVTFSKKQKKANSYMLEVELRVTNPTYYRKDIQKFVKLFKAKESKEGKTGKGIRLLCE